MPVRNVIFLPLYNFCGVRTRRTWVPNGRRQRPEDDQAIITGAIRANIDNAQASSNNDKNLGSRANFANRLQELSEEDGKSLVPMEGEEHMFTDHIAPDITNCPVIVTALVMTRSMNKRRKNKSSKKKKKKSHHKRRKGRPKGTGRKR